MPLKRKDINANINHTDVTEKEAKKAKQFTARDEQRAGNEKQDTGGLVECEERRELPYYVRRAFQEHVRHVAKEKAKPALSNDNDFQNDVPTFHALKDNPERVPRGGGRRGYRPRRRLCVECHKRTGKVCSHQFCSKVERIWHDNVYYGTPVCNNGSCLQHHINRFK